MSRDTSQGAPSIFQRGHPMSPQFKASAEFLLGWRIPRKRWQQEKLMQVEAPKPCPKFLPFHLAPVTVTPG